MEGSVQEARPSRRQADAPRGPAMSAGQKAYFDGLYAEAMRAYAIAKQARRKGLDPSMEVEIPPAEDLAARVEAQVGPEGVAQRIRQATKEIGNRELVSLRVAEEVADDLVKQGEGREKCLDNAVRTGLSILTEGVLVAPLEGIAEVKIGANMDGTDYVDLWFAGPIRAAGGTGQAMSVLIADVVRRKLGIGKFVPTDAEVERYKEEIPAYKQAANLQYTPTGPEIELIARNCPICINGEGTEQVEVTGNRDLPRVEGNRLRGGACLVMAEGLVLKAPKVMKHVDKLGLEGWGFLGEFMKKAKADDEGEEDPDAVPEIPPVEKFIKDIIAGRPVFGHPSRPGAFRLRYGRARTGGLAANAFSAATMTLVDDFLAVGTQLKVERPGKGTLATPCDGLDGPTVVMKNGDLRRLRTVAEVKEYRPAVDEIVDLGEILIPFGEFAENNALLPDSSWVWEWWVQMHQQATGSDLDVGFEGTLSGSEMVELAETTGVPLHPDATLLWHDIGPADIRTLSEWVRDRGVWESDAGHDEADVHDAEVKSGVEAAGSDDLATGQLIITDTDPACKDLLVRLLCLHRVDGGRLRIDPPLSLPFLRSLGLEVDDGRIVETDRRRMLYDGCQPDFTTRFPSVELAGRLAGFALMPRAPCRIGGRMGRPEKADVRKMKPPIHGLFPIGNAGGNQRLIVDAAKKGRVDINAAERHCTQCRAKEQWRLRCGRCDGRTEPAPRPKDVRDYDLPLMSIDLKAELRRALEALGMHRPPDVKGVIGVINKEKVPEPLEKAILRAKHKLWTFKDGTVRYDMTDVPITHFKPAEIHAPVERLHELGYTHDWQGDPLERDDQVVEMRVQDLIVSNGCMDYFLRTAQFLDELLERFYGLKPYHNATKREDMIGHFTIGLAPHTSGGVLSRIIGWTGAQVHYAHPYFHAAKRRNCLAPDTEIRAFIDGQEVLVTVESLFKRASDETERRLEDGSRLREASGTEVLSVSPADGQVRRRPVIHVRQVQAPAHLIRFVTEASQEIVCSPGHRMEVIRDGAMVKVEASAVNEGDFVPCISHHEGSWSVAPERIRVREHVRTKEAWLYDFEVAEDHNFALANGLVTSNCDGDEDALLLLMDGLLNFSRHYVPDRRGGLMDLPLVLTTRLDPNEIDKEAHNVDTLRRYPLSFYEATTRHANSKDVSQTMRMVEELIGTPEQYEGFGFTHDTADIAEGPAASAYKVLDTTMEKLTGQMELARKIRAVDEPDVGAKVIGTHLLPDIMGNLKAFSKQKVRCPQCNAKYRRMPLKGVCLQCGNPKLTLTVHEGSVRKYLEISKEIADKYHIDAYTRQRIMLLEQGVESLFNNDKVRKSKLDEFF